MDHEKKPGGQAGQKPRPSSGELLSSAKVVADAAKASLRHEADKVDKGRVAGAAADLLGAASRYGKLEEKSMGKYVDKAEGYLRGYHSSQSAHAGAATTATATTGYSSPSHAGEAAHSAAAAAGAGGGKSGYGEYVKIAQGLMNAHSGGGGGSGAGAGAGAGAGPGGQHSGGGGYGDYIKMAEGFLKKH